MFNKKGGMTHPRVVLIWLALGQLWEIVDTNIIADN